MRTRRAGPAPVPRSAFAGFRFPPDVIVLAVRWYLRFGLSYRDVEELLAERGVEVDHVSVYRWVQRFTRLLAEAARRFFERAITTTKITPVEVVTDKAATYPTALGELLPAAWHRTDQYANNYIEADHGRLKARLGPMRGLKQDRSAKVVIAGHAFVQNVRRGHYELAVEEPETRRVRSHSTSWPWRPDARPRRGLSMPRTKQMQHRHLPSTLQRVLPAEGSSGLVWKPIRR